MAFPRGPRGPKLWTLIRFAADPVGFFEGCRRRYGDLFTIRVPGFPTTVAVCDPETIKLVFQGQPETMRAGEANPNNPQVTTA